MKRVQGSGFRPRILFGTREGGNGWVVLALSVAAAGGRGILQKLAWIVTQNKNWATKMKSKRILSLCFASCTLIVVGCQSPTNGIRNNPKVKEWVSQIKAEEKLDGIFTRRIAGYNQAVWVGQIEKIDASPFVKDTDAKAVSLTKAQVVYQQYHEASVPTLLFSSNTFANKPFPKPGEVWTVLGSANNSGIWFLLDAIKAENGSSTDRSETSKP